MIPNLIQGLYTLFLPDYVIEKWTLVHLNNHHPLAFQTACHILRRRYRLSKEFIGTTYFDPKSNSKLYTLFLPDYVIEKWTLVCPNNGNHHPIAFQTVCPILSRRYRLSKEFIGTTYFDPKSNSSCTLSFCEILSLTLELRFILIMIIIIHLH